MIQPDKGILLIADPFLTDPSFTRSVVLLCEHKPEGSFGFVINKEFDMTLNQLIPELEDFNIPVCYGGPVQRDTLHFLHSIPQMIPGGYEISDGIYWGGDFEKTTYLLKNDELDLRKIRFYVGYSGWGEGQLQNEMKEKSWLTVFANKKIVFNKNLSEIWKASIKELGGKYEEIIHYPIDPQLN